MRQSKQTFLGGKENVKKKKKKVQAAHNNIATFRAKMVLAPSRCLRAASLLSGRAGRELLKHSENSAAHKETEVSSKTAKHCCCSWNSLTATKTSGAPEWRGGPESKRWNDAGIMRPLAGGQSGQWRRQDV